MRTCPHGVVSGQCNDCLAATLSTEAQMLAALRATHAQLPEETTMEHYRMDNTTGYTQAELDALNAELATLLGDLAASTDGNPSPDEVDALLKRHADDVARR